MLKEAIVLLAKSPGVLDSILDSSQAEARILGEKIKHSLPLDESELHIDAEIKPGGRNNNDRHDIRKISIMPTADELLSQERAFLRMAEYMDNADLETSLQNLYMDNQFCLLREDMLREMREEIKDVTGAKTGRHKGTIVGIHRPVGVNMGVEKKNNPGELC